MRIQASVVKLCVCLTLIVLTPQVLAMEVNINFLLGGKSLDEDDWGEADGQGLFGVETTFGDPEWPVAVALDYMVSAYYDDVFVLSSSTATTGVLQATWELDAGVRKIWKAGKARPFVGGGVGILGASQERGVILGTIDDTDSTLGLWFNGGAFWRLGKRFNIGVDLRLSAGQVSLFDRDVQAGGGSLGLLLGWGWGDR